MPWLVALPSLLQFHSKPIERAINGQPSVLVRQGKYVEKNMNQERVPPEEIYSAMRESGIERLSQVRWASLEPDGKISIVPEEAASHGVVTSKDVNAEAG